MALKTINDLTALTTPAATDFVGVWNVSGGVTRKTTLAQMVTQAGVAALLASANTFTTSQTITNTSANAYSLLIIPNTTALGSCGVQVAGIDNGASYGPRILIGRNYNASTPAAGSLVLVMMDGTNKNVWIDAAGVARVSTAAAAPTNATDTSGGTVIGAQTSHVAFKDIIGDPVPDVAALENIKAAAGTVKRFVYKSGAYNGQEFSGVVLDGDELMRYGEDADNEHPAGKALNVINALGDIMLALREIDRRLTALESV